MSKELAQDVRDYANDVLSQMQDNHGDDSEMMEMYTADFDNTIKVADAIDEGKDIEQILDEMDEDAADELRTFLEEN